MGEEISPVGPMKVQLGHEDYTFHLPEDIPLDEWQRRVTDKIPEDMLWKKSSERQMKVFRALRLNGAVVCSSHTSKSCKLPVVYGQVFPGVLVRIRGNFYDWKVSVESEMELDIDHEWLFKPMESHSACYFEGFKEEWIFGPYAEDKRRFSVEIPYDHLYLIEFVRRLREAAA